jgi:hypothetical protein
MMLDLFLSSIIDYVNEIDGEATARKAVES